MICKNCGQELPENVNFCMNCGEKQKLKTDNKLYVELIYNRSGVDIYSNDEEIIKVLYKMSTDISKEKHVENLSGINSGQNLWGFQYTKKSLLDFKDNNAYEIVSSAKDYLLKDGWIESKKVRGIDTSKYKMIFTKNHNNK